MTAAHQGQQAGTQMSPRHGVERGVDGLVGEPYRIGHTSQCARNLRRTQALATMIDHDDPERIAGHQLARNTRSAGQHPRSPVCWNASIPSGHSGSHSPSQLWRGRPAVATHLAGDGEMSPPMRHRIPNESQGSFTARNDISSARPGSAKYPHREVHPAMSPGRGGPPSGQPRPTSCKFGSLLLR